jgi:transcriptional regulator with PAS, ATPase and Fis domain
MNLIEAKSWAAEMDVRITVCDLKGIIVYMNDASVLGFHKYGGADLIGKSLLDCHNIHSQSKIKAMLEFPQVNVYVLNKKHEKRIIRQFPWVEDGDAMGIIELSFDLPLDFSME